MLRSRPLRILEEKWITSGLILATTEQRLRLGRASPYPLRSPVRDRLSQIQNSMGDIMRHSLALFGCIAPVLLAAPATLHAADETIERIIVTAQKRETDLQDVPFSVSATTEAQIRNSGASNVVELSRNVSGLIMTDLGPGQSQVSVRGISAGQVV